MIISKHTKTITQLSPLSVLGESSSVVLPRFHAVEPAGSDVCIALALIQATTNILNDFHLTLV